MATIEQKGMYGTFPRSGKNVSFTHYCPGCGHGIIIFPQKKQKFSLTSVGNEAVPDYFLPAMPSLFMR